MSEEKKQLCGYVFRKGEVCGKPALKGAQCATAVGNKERCRPHNNLPGHAPCRSCKTNYVLITAKQKAGTGMCKPCKEGKNDEGDEGPLSDLVAPDIEAGSTKEEEKPKNDFAKIAYAFKMVADQLEILSLADQPHHG